MILIAGICLRSRICLRISEQIQIRAVELDMFYSVVEGVVWG